MIRKFLIPFAIMIAVATASSALAQEAPSCQFVLGFATRASMIPVMVGTCLQDEQQSPANDERPARPAKD